MFGNTGFTVKERATAQHGSWGYFIIYTLLRLFQLVGGITVFGLYYSLIQQEAHPFGADTTTPEWMAVLVGAISALDALIEALPFLPPIYFPLNAVICLWYIIVFGIYGKMYIGADPSTLSSTRMQTYVHAMWLDCANAVLWALTLGYTIMLWRKRRQLRVVQESFA